jgi:hypothetical protein
MQSPEFILQCLRWYLHSRFVSLFVLHVQVSQWTSACLEGCMKRLTGLNKPYKYVVTCIIMQKTGAQPKHTVVAVVALPLQ